MKMPSSILLLPSHHHEPDGEENGSGCIVSTSHGRVHLTVDQIKRTKGPIQIMKASMRMGFARFARPLEENLTSRNNRECRSAILPPFLSHNNQRISRNHFLYNFDRFRISVRRYFAAYRSITWRQNCSGKKRATEAIHKAQPRSY